MDPSTSNEDAALTGFVNFSEATPPRLHDQGIYTEIESARADSLRLGQSINFWSDTHHRNFDTLVRMYYHATLIYSDQALSVTPIASTNMKVSHDHIMNDLKQLSQLEAGFHHAQDFIWPLFIAGTELRGDRAGQALIERHFKTVMRISRTLDRDRVLSFLMSWWEEDSDRQTSWIQYARERSSDYNLLIV
ncbi:unnamed protein product [Penicillium salamii]|uniref:Uncharacterized protein n=1 Tax=Penicillium salamii TaxID=1612424 RepID=A0A9W4I8B3_9EURO|nr:unnamed protein product [Penicillium salamii]